jgi:hypothetical protein
VTVLRELAENLNADLLELGTTAEILSTLPHERITDVRG